jgi:glycosyltransferase involved in cell wall biosynthesis
MHPQITIVTATKNRPDLLRRAIKNVQAQSLPDWEMQIVDDGDGAALEVVRQIGDPRLHAQQNPGTGQVDARNAAIRAANANLIHLLDDDDRWADNKHLETVVQKLERHSGLLIRGGWLVLEELTPDSATELGRREFNPSVTPETLRRDNTILTSGAAYPKSLHQTLGMLDPNMGNYWDWDWWLRASTHGLETIPQPCVLMSWRDNNTSKNPEDPRRKAYLEGLCQKHGLGNLESKNHATVLAH